MYLDKSGCIRAKMVLFGQKGCIWEKLFCSGKVMYSVKVVVFRQNLLYLGKSGCIRAKWFYSGKCGCIRDNLEIFGQSECICEKEVEFGQK